MRQRIAMMLFTFQISFPCLAQHPSIKTAFCNVTIIDVVSCITKEHQTVLVKNGMIDKVGNASQIKPANDYALMEQPTICGGRKM
jgi:hypothetical protein